MDRLTIERIGGFAGLGLPGSRLQSRGEVAPSTLSPADQALVESLFGKTPQGKTVHPDGFTYRITRNHEGHEETVEVPEDAVPDALKASVKNTLK